MARPGNCKQESEPYTPQAWLERRLSSLSEKPVGLPRFPGFREFLGFRASKLSPGLQIRGPLAIGNLGKAENGTKSLA